MKTKRFAALALAFLSTLNPQLSTLFAQGTAFTYQGRLNDGGIQASGSYDLSFSLWNAASGPSQVGGTITNSATAVSNGLFTVVLDFGNQFPGANRWLEIGVRTNGGGAFTSLSPRQPITSTPYAVRALDAGSAASYVGAISDNQLSGNIARLNGSNVFSGVVQFNNTSNNFAGTFTGNGAGVTNVMMTTLNAPGILSWPGNYVLSSSPAVGSGPRSVVATDVNGDGKLDLISANSGGNSLTILTNNGSGGFVAASTNAVGIQPRSVAAADVNGDGKPDLICTSQSPGTLIVLTNLGNGSFVPASTNVIGATVGNPQMVAAADINGDGKPDLISANGNSPGTLSVFTNKGSGSFVSSSTNSVANNPVAVTAADVNGDNFPDLISANNNAGGTLSVLLNNGSGGFSPAIQYIVGNSPRSVTAADVNGDGYRDLISANNGDGTLSVSLNNGSGGFPVGTPISIGSTPIWVTAADINGDGRVDLICANNGPGTLTAVTNNGSGIFLPAFTNSVGALPNAVIAADLNGDGKVDLVSANGSGTLSVLFNVPNFTGAFAGNGAGLTSLDASQLASGTVADARLSANVALLNGSATFSGTVQAATFLGDGSQLTGVVAASLAIPQGMALIPAGSFTMGNSIGDGDITDATPISATVSAFYMDVNLVSLSQWQSVYFWATNHGYGFVNAGSGKGPNHPVQMVDWYDAVKWCNARSQQAGRPPVYFTDAGLTQVYTNGVVATLFPNWAVSGYRLPTEAEWEKAARGGLSGQRFPWGNLITQNLGNYFGNTANYPYDLGPNDYNPIGSIGGISPATSPVGSFAANGYGLFDMAGNVRQWCWDWYGTPYAGGTDPRGLVSGTTRVLRSGSSNTNARYSRCAERGNGTPTFAFDYIGFRCVRGL